MNKPIIEYDDFEKVEILTGTIIEVTENIKARKPAYVMKIDFGEKIGIKFSSAQITNYSIEELINKQVVAVCNFEKKNIAGIESEVLVLGSIDQDNKVILLQPDIVVKNGSPVA
jgi:tRNA-binding protein